MNQHLPEHKPAAYLAADTAIRPDASDFIEQPEIEPVATTRERLPIWLYVVCGVALFLAGGSFTGIELGPGYYDEGMGGGVLLTHDDQGPPAESTNPMEIGKKLYNGNCASCHQASGAGQPGAYPPLIASQWVTGGKEMLAAILINGVAGPLNVNGSPYGTNVMPAWPNLSDANLAAIATYIRGSWGNTADAFKPEDIASVRAKDGSRTNPWAEADLMKMKGK